MPLDVLIVDDDRIIVEWVRDRLAETDSLSIAGEFSDGAACLSFLRKHSSDLVILDLGIKGGLHGLEAGPKIREVRPEIKILVLSQYDGYFPQVESWADGYLLKRDAPSKLLKAIEKVLRGREFVSPAVRAANNRQAASLFRKLRKSELAVVREVLANRTKNEIATELQIQGSTVYKHLQNIYNTLELEGDQRSIAGLIRFAKAAGVVPPQL